jgi:hypothetical protein
MQNAFTTISVKEADVICTALLRYSKRNTAAINVLSVSCAIDLYDSGNEDVESLTQALHQNILNQDDMTKQGHPVNAKHTAILTDIVS